MREQHSQNPSGKRYPFTVMLSHGMRAWFAQHGKENGLSVEAAVQMGAECYADSLRIQRRRDDALYDRLRVPKKDRCY